MAKMVAYGDFPKTYGKMDHTRMIVDYALKDVPDDLKGLLEPDIRERVARGWTSFDHSLPDNIMARPWEGDLSLDRLFEDKGLTDDIKAMVGRRLCEASVWLLQRALLVLVLKHGKQQGRWDGTPEGLDFDFMDGAELGLEMSLIEGSNICVLSHGVEGGKLTLKAYSTLLR